MKHTVTRLNSTNRRSWRTFVSLISLVLFLLIAGACESPISDDDAVETETPVSTEATVPDRPDDVTPTPEAIAEEREDGWTVITGRERIDPPEDRSSDQIFRMAGPSDAPTTIDPALVRDTDSAFLARQVFRGLVRLDAALEPVPDLARQIEIDPEGRLYRFVLHEGITFHDGTEITATHIKASLERAADPALAGGDGQALASRNYLDDIEGARERMDGERDDIPGIQVIDDLTVEISLDRGVVDFLERMTNSSTLIVDTRQTEIDGSWWQDANGSGPFRLGEWDPDSQITLVAHDGYVVPPVLEQVEIRVGAEAVGQMQLYETEQIDYVHVPLSVLDRIQYDGSPIPGELREESLMSTSFVMFSPIHEPYSNEAFREALIRTMPRDQISSVMLDGRVETANGILPPVMTGQEMELFPFDHDPEIARERFESIDLDAEFDQVTIYSSGGSIPVAMKYFVEQELGLPVEVVQLRWSDYMTDMEEGRLPIFVLTWVADGPDPVSFLRALFHSESPDNYAGFSDAEVDQLLDQASIEQDDEQRMELIFDAHERILDSAVVMPLYHSVDFVLVADHVRGLETTSMGIIGLETVGIGN